MITNDKIRFGFNQLDSYVRVSLTSVFRTILISDDGKCNEEDSCLYFNTFRSAGIFSFHQEFPPFEIYTICENFRTLWTRNLINCGKIDVVREFMLTHINKDI